LLRRFQSVKEPAPMDAKAELGRKLFYETRLSKDKNLSCNGCHDLARYGVDGAATSTGYQGKRGDRNAPTVLNASLGFVQFWDGRAPHVEEQAKGPILNPGEMAMPHADVVVDVLKKIPGYVTEFKAVYPDDREPVTFDHVGDAIGAFERRLLTPGRWDRFL